MFTEVMLWWGVCGLGVSAFGRVQKGSLSFSRSSIWKISYMIEMQGYLCLIASLLLSGVCATPVSKDEHSAEHHDHLHHDKDQAHIHNEAHEAAAQLLSPHNADFAFALYRHLSTHKNDSKPENVFFSPLGISSALSMLAVGAKGTSHEELFQTLGYGDLTQAKVNDAYEHMFHSLGHSQGELQLDFGNAAVVQENFKPLAKFLEDLKHYYHSEGFTVDFTNSEEAAKVINDFIAKKTENKITDMVKSLDQDTVMMLINYIFFRGKWEKPFDPEHTKKADFHVDENTTVSVDMMKKSGRFSYFYDNDNKTAVVLLPYQGKASMMIVLPNEGKMKELEETISKEDVRRWHNSLFKNSLDLYLPKFSASATYSLSNIFKEMGLRTVFSHSADLSGISEEVGLKVSEISHKAILSVDEKGTEAAAVTTVEIMPMSLPWPMKVDRPFLLLILEESTKSILFMGKITDPTAQ
ncbi:alpha-1-antitrypsin homolog isoform X1 [Brienomyrus brachyistius]|uniref:alpha-1-antitrypsin homolog isoform X1 n=1 Tax=Brienomyrus brachyistius TaxID=42636 RepID=UPI0020B2778D|nr:alpha-1-antitrypsin homolog isoform X1 [Brienomyrus brachyistius]